MTQVLNNIGNPYVYKEIILPESTEETSSPWLYQFIENQTSFLVIGVTLSLVAIYLFLKEIWVFIKQGFQRLRCFERDLDSYKLLVGRHEMASSQFAWHLNASILREAYASSQDPNQKKQIQFLMTNYLDKAAPIHMKEMRAFSSDLEEMFQIGPFNSYAYHRMACREHRECSQEIRKEFALPGKCPLILTDSDEVVELFPTSFSVVNPEKVDELASVLKSHFAKYRQNPSEGFNHSLELPILFDLTEPFADSIRTLGDKVNERAFATQLRQFKNGLKKSIDLAIDELKKEYPELAKSYDHKGKMRSYIKKNITALCRVKIGSIGGIKVIPLFEDLGERSLQKSHPTLINFIEETGIYLGSVNLRKYVRDSHAIQGAIRYAPEGANVLYFPNKEDLLHLALFQRLSEKFNLAENISAAPHITTLGGATMRLLSGLLEKIDQEKWVALNADPAVRLIVQASLYKIKESLAHAELYMGDYKQFAQCIEFIHAEIATLLELAHPYQEGDFSPIYLDRLQRVPESLRPYLKAGLGKTAMTVFAGINSALIRTTPQPVRACCQGLYYEQAHLMGENCHFDAIVANPAIKKVDLYVGQFNPNIEIETAHRHYTKRNVIHDIRELLKTKSDTRELTVAIDATIDYFNSPDNEELLREFEHEIHAGRLNFIFFHSGMKFDLLGMDNYYGAPFYMVNNGAAHWESFNRLLTEKVFKTDSLSHQWFCLSNQCASKEMDAYRALIFNNTKEILNNLFGHVMATPDEDQPFRVSTVDPKMEPSFIDVKITGRFHRVKCILLIALLYLRCLKEGIKIHSRASFGFYHINCIMISVNAVDGSSSIRINPSLNPKENLAITHFLNSLPNYFS